MSSSSATAAAHQAPKPLIKPVFSSPGQLDSVDSSSCPMDALISKHSFPEDLEKSLANMKREEHEKRLKGLRKELDFITNTNWQFQHTGDEKSSLKSLILTMPKEEKHLKPLRDRRMQKRDKLAATGDATVSSNIFFQVIGNGVSGGERALFLYTDHNRYLFNCSEGTQRLTTEQCPARALAQLTNIFVTSKTWKNLGGFPGMCLTIRASGAPDVRMHGPDGTMSLFDSIKHFILLFEFDVVPHEYKDGQFCDGSVTVDAVRLEYSGPNVVPAKTPWCPERSVGLNKQGEDINGRTFASARDDKEEPSPIDQTSLAYVITLRGKPGKLLMDKCIQLGVPPGPLLGELKAGRDVVLEGGRTVRSEEVMGEASASQRCLVIECPSESFLTSLLDSPKLNEELHSAQSPVPYVFHFTPKAVMMTVSYKAWMAKFDAKTVHVLLNDHTAGFSSQDVLAYTKKLQMVAPGLFPPLWERSKSDFGGEDLSLTFAGMETAVAQSAMRFQLRPHLGPDSSEMKAFDEEVVSKEVLAMEGVPDLIEKAHSDMKKVAASAPEFPRVTFLGTGSSVPNKYRCVSAILVEVEEDRFILMDCGEGSLLQLHRHFGAERAHHVLRRLKAVYISHLHADHHLGLINIIQERTRAFAAAGEETERLFVVAPGRIDHFLSYYHREFEPFLDDAYQVKNEHLLLNSPMGSSDIKTQLLYPHVLEDLLRATGLKGFYTSRAVHCPHSFCVAFTTVAGFKVVYTGDTRPNQALVELGRHLQPPDLLIHEATMEQLLLEDAIKKRHSTLTEAVLEGREMGAKFTILTHFSQRYSKMPTLEEFESAENVGIAFDNLSVTPRTFGHIRLMYPSLAKIFAEDIDLIEQRRAKFLSRNAVEKELNMDGDVRRISPAGEGGGRKRFKLSERL